MLGAGWYTSSVHIMSASKTTIEAALRQAAEIRARGLSWEAVAHDLGRHPDTCRRWPRRYPLLWRRLLRQARIDVTQDGGAEAKATLRKLLRVEDNKTRLAAAEGLLKRRTSGRKQTAGLSPEDEELAAFVSEVKGLSDDDLEEMLRQALADGHAASGTSNPQGSAPSQ